MPDYIDLTQLVYHHMPVYDGDSPLALLKSSDVEKDGYSDFTLHSGMHVGTHVDGPAHMIIGGKSIFEYEADRFFGECDVLDARNCTKVIDDELIIRKTNSNSNILLICTDHSQYFGDEKYYSDYPAISKSFAQRIVDSGYKMVGMDSPSPDYHPFEIHQILLKNDVLIIENLCNLDQLIGKPRIEITALPMKLKSDSAPVRVIAKLL